MRGWRHEIPRDLAIAHAFLKHFGLHEWDVVAGVVFSAAKWVIFSCPIAAEDHDDGTEFHHVHVTRDRLTTALMVAGKVVVQSWPDEPDQPYGRCLFIAGPAR